MKKIFFVVISVFILLSILGCDKKEESVQDSEENIKINRISNVSSTEQNYGVNTKFYEISSDKNITEFTISIYEKNSNSWTRMGNTTKYPNMNNVKIGVELTEDICAFYIIIEGDDANFSYPLNSRFDNLKVVRQNEIMSSTSISTRKEKELGSILGTTNDKLNNGFSFRDSDCTVGIALTVEVKL